MQFPVPQFTEVEDKIIGPLTIKQFGIIFGVGIVIFLGYSATKSLPVLIVLFLLFGLPGLALAFGQINGRPIYNSFGYFLKFFMSPKVLIFHKEAQTISSSQNLKDAKLSSQFPGAEADKLPLGQKAKLSEVQALLAKTAEAESQMTRQMKQ